MQYISNILICVIIICTIITLVNQKQVEGYRPFYYHKKYCPDCGYKNRRRCRKCINCGFCWTYDGRGECVPGDEPDPAVEAGYRQVIDKYAPSTPPIKFIERYEFYKRASESFVVVMSGDTRQYANIILKKGIS